MRLKPLAVRFKQGDQPPRRRIGILGRRLDSFEIKADPRLPVAIHAHSLQQLVIPVAILLEEQAQVKNRLVDYVLRAQHERNQLPPQTAIAVEKGVNAFKLYVRERGFDQWRHTGCIGMQKLLECVETLQHLPWRRGNIDRVAGPVAANPVLACAELSRLLLASSSAAQQHAVHLPQQTQR